LENYYGRTTVEKIMLKNCSRRSIKGGSIFLEKKVMNSRVFCFPKLLLKDSEATTKDAPLKITIDKLP
jgi:hypothetical protein